MRETAIEAGGGPGGTEGLSLHEIRVRILEEDDKYFDNLEDYEWYEAMSAMHDIEEALRLVGVHISKHDS